MFRVLAIFNFRFKIKIQLLRAWYMNQLSSHRKFGYRWVLFATFFRSIFFLRCRFCCIFHILSWLQSFFNFQTYSNSRFRIICSCLSSLKISNFWQIHTAWTVKFLLNLVLLTIFHSRVRNRRRAGNKHRALKIRQK